MLTTLQKVLYALPCIVKTNLPLLFYNSVKRLCQKLHSREVAELSLNSDCNFISLGFAGSQIADWIVILEWFLSLLCGFGDSKGV